MYTSFYKLHSKPFQISSDPAFMWFGEKHKEALATLKYGILDNKGFLLLTGDVGTGKTSLINTLVQSLSQDIICATVPDPSLDKMDFFNYIAAGFGIGREFLAKGAFLAHFRKFLLQANENGKKVLLIIDEAQLLTQEMLEEIRLLSNIEKADSKLINIFFIGQNEFNQILNRPQNRAVRQRLTLNYNLDPLTPDETEAYIRHRLKVAGTSEPIFGLSAVREVFLYSGGFPRRINILCDHSLLSGYVKEQSVIDAAIVRECAQELKIPAHVPNRDINGFSPSRPIKESKATTPPKEPGPVLTPRPTATPPPSPPATEDKDRSKPWVWLVALILCCLFFWMFLFPKHFRNIALSASQRFNFVKETISLLVPESLKETPAGSDSKELASASPSQQKSKSSFNSNPLHEPIQEQTGKPVHIDGSINESHTLKKEQEPEEPAEVATKVISSISNLTGENPQIKPIQEKIILNGEIDKEQVSSGNINSAVKEIIVFKENPQQPLGLASKNPEVQTKSKETFQNTNLILPLPSKKIIVRFKYNTNDFTLNGLQELEDFSRILAGHPERKIMITGYTDSEGYAKYNKKLSEFRANIVKSYLLGKGVIEPERVTIKGMGGANPVETNSTAWGRMMNRRVEIEIIN